MGMPFDAFSNVSDEALLVLYANGDRAAARALTERLTPYAWRIAVRFLGDHAEAEDIAQEAMLRLWRIAPEWRQGEAQVRTWLTRVVRNLCTDRYRRTRKDGPALDTIADPEDPQPRADARLIDHDRAQALTAALDALPDRQREAVVLRHIEGLSNPEIAAAMDISVEAVESLTARGKRALANLLAGRRADLGYDDD